MSEISFKKNRTGTVEDCIASVTEALAKIGFGILTRIDMHKKIKEKLNKDMAETVILGACNPALAYEALQLNPEVAALLPCNVVVKKINATECEIALLKPSAMLGVLNDTNLKNKVLPADEMLSKALESL